MREHAWPASRGTPSIMENASTKATAHSSTKTQACAHSAAPGGCTSEPPAFPLKEYYKIATSSMTARQTSPAATANKATEL